MSNSEYDEAMDDQRREMDLVRRFMALTFDEREAEMRRLRALADAEAQPLADAADEWASLIVKSRDPRSPLYPRATVQA